jgi:hypothetical protein
MEFRIADTFTDSLARLALHEQKAAKTTALDLQLNPAAPGLKFHRIDTMRPQDSSRRRRWDAIRDRRARRRLPRQHATSDHGDRRQGRRAVYVPIRIGGKIVVPAPAAQ